MSSQKLMRGRRSGVAGVVALVIVALAALGAIAAIQIRAGHHSTVFGSVTAVTHRLHGHDWANSAVLIIGIVVAAIGLLVLLAGLLPARRKLLALTEPEPNTLFAITRSGLARDLTAVASSVDGVSSATVHLRRRRVRVYARSAMRDRTGLSDSVRSAVVRRIDALAPAKPLKVRTTIKEGRD